MGFATVPSASEWIGFAVGAAQVLAALPLILMQARGLLRHRIYCGLESVVPLTHAHPASSGLSVSYDGVLLNDPHAVRLTVRVHSPQPITSEKFHGEEPVRFNIDAVPVDILSVTSEPTYAANPPVVVGDDKTVQLAPAHLHRRQRLVIEMLTDGEPTDVKVQSSLIGFDVTTRHKRSQSRRYTQQIRAMILWGAVVTMIFFIAFRPHSAAEIFRAIGSGISEFVQLITPW